MLMRYLSGALLVATLAAAGWAYVERAGRLSAQAEAASLRRSVAVLEDARAQARSAAEVARAEAERQAARAAEYDALKEALLRGGDDVALPDWFDAWGCAAGLWLCEADD
ncbi:MAG: hypothetical protein JXQ91_07775 [Vannielia sp.]|uniref:hypothetical protein n=1 Tax=Vannielia sp. TaxID=2813045 RepID=UPI003B8C7F96